MICLIVFTLFVNLVFVQPVRPVLGKHLSVIGETTFPAYGKAPFPYRGNLLSLIGAAKGRVFTKKAPLVCSERGLL